jgi:hypothetical protein
LLPARIIALADVIAVYQRTSGDRGAIAVAQQRSGTQFDPDLVDLGPTSPAGPSDEPGLNCFAQAIHTGSPSQHAFRVGPHC